MGQTHRKPRARTHEPITAADAEKATGITQPQASRWKTKTQNPEAEDKYRDADTLYRMGTRDADELMDLLSITEGTLKKYLEDAKRDEKEAAKAKVWDFWLDCLSERQITDATGVPQKTVNDWVSEKRTNSQFAHPPESRQHFDIWQFQKADGESSYFGRMPPPGGRLADTRHPGQSPVKPRWCPRAARPPPRQPPSPKRSPRLKSESPAGLPAANPRPKPRARAAPENAARELQHVNSTRPARAGGWRCRVGVFGPGIPNSRADRIAGREVGDRGLDRPPPASQTDAVVPNNAAFMRVSVTFGDLSAKLGRSWERLPGAPITWTVTR